MHRPRFLLRSERPLSLVGPLPEPVLLSTEQSHHLINVLRREAGSEVELFYADSSIVCIGVITDADSSAARIEVREARAATSGPAIHVIVGSPKQKAAEFIVQRCTEAGAAGIHFFQADHSPFAIPSAKAAQTVARWEKIRDSAAQQARSPRECRITFSPSFSELLQGLYAGSARHPAASQLRLLLAGPGEACGSQIQPPRITDILWADPIRFGADRNGLEKPDRNDEIHIVVGPEGGLSASERDCASEFGYREASLGASVFRTETAALVAASIAALS